MIAEPHLRSTLSAVLWDMDGTLIDTEPLWLEAELAMLGRYDIQLPAETRDSLIGSGLRDAARLFQQLGVPLATSEIISEWVASVKQGITDSTPAWRPGARELLASLKDAQIPCALVTMSVRSLAEQVVSLLPKNSFQVIIAGDEVQHEKPHPEPYLLGAKALGVNSEHCLAFEDSPTGLRSAYGAGTIAVGVPNLLSLEAAPSHALLSSLLGLDAFDLQEMYASLRTGKELSREEFAIEELSK